MIAPWRRVGPDMVECNMLVYFINHSVAPANLGGAERSMIKLVEDWYASDPDFEAFFITKAPRGLFIKAIEERGWKYKAFAYRGWTIPKHDAPVSEITYFARYDYASTLDIIKLMEERRPDLVVTNTIVAPWGAFAAKTLGIPHAWFVREYGDLDHGLAFQIGRADTFTDIGMLSEAVFANSHAVKSHIGQYLDESKVSVIYPGLDVPRIQELAKEPPARAPFPANDKSLKITVVGRLAKSKGQWRVIDALGELTARGVDARLCLVGSWIDPGYDMQMMKRAAGHGVADRLTIVGEQSNPFPYLAAADVCVTPSSIEAFGRTTLEAMILGKPVVAAARGGSAELIAHDETGYLFDLQSPAELVDHLERYANDRALVAQHGAAAKSRSGVFQSHEFSNAAAIERLKHTSTMPAYRLPSIARYWFSLPEHYFDIRRAPRITISFIMTRLGGRTRALFVRPFSALRRRAQRS
nr:glycosyltransferase family 4 protein [Leifsonia psychrotolerans]